MVRSISDSDEYQFPRISSKLNRGGPHLKVVLIPAVQGYFWKCIIMHKDANRSQSPVGPQLSGTVRSWTHTLESIYGSLFCDSVQFEFVNQFQSKRKDSSQTLWKSNENERVIPNSQRKFKLVPSIKAFFSPHHFTSSPSIFSLHP